MKLLNREEIIASTDLKSEKVEVPEWDGFVYVRCMTGTVKDNWENEVYSIKGKNVEINKENFRARLLVRVLCDENGNRIFTDSDMAILGGKSGQILDQLFTVALRINGLSHNDVDELTKN